jgi:hypothetical protein
MDVIFKPATKIMEAILDTDQGWWEKRTKDHDKSKMRVLNSVLTRVIQIYNTYGFYVKPTKEVKEGCPELYEWLTSKDITRVDSLNFRGKHDSACTNLPIVFAVIARMIEKKSLLPTGTWSKRVTYKGLLKTGGQRKGKNHDTFAHPYSHLFGCQFDVQFSGHPLQEETHLLKRNLEQIFNSMVYARQKPLFQDGATLRPNQMVSEVVDNRFFSAVRAVTKDMTWKEMVDNLGLDDITKKKKKKPKIIQFDGFLTKQEVRVLNTTDLEESIERLEEVERRFLEKAAHTRVNIQMLRHVNRADGTIPYNKKFLTGTGGSDVPFPRVLVKPLVDQMKDTLLREITLRIRNSWHGLKDFQALWDGVTSDAFPCEMEKNLQPIGKLICNLVHIIIG